MRRFKTLIKKYKLYWLIILPILYSVYYLGTYSKAMPEAIDALNSDSLVTVVQSKWISFSPLGEKGNSGKGIIFYPGGKVAPESYAPLMRALAKEGYTVFIAKMPFNLAIFKSGAATEILSGNPQIKQWYIGGHSLGGTMAAQYVNKHPDTFDGIFFIASYPIENYDLSDDAKLRSLSIYGENDGLIDLTEVTTHKLYLPKDQTVLVLDGANHGQFGYYGIQDKDKPATITRETQQAMTLEALLKWLK